ncbi:Fc.00g012140.m01.CDS01 [Cosmosporella sp. VM-42]
MENHLKKQVAKRCQLIQVHDHCPERPYIELKVPEDAKAVVAISFMALSRDQGCWADDAAGFSYTFFNATVRRPAGRPDLRTLVVISNRRGNPKFSVHRCRWHLDDGIYRRSWLQGLQAGDVIQLVPKAIYPSWVNIVKEASIKIEYEARSVNEDHIIPALGNFQDSIEGFFSTVSVRDFDPESLDFHALSYCWGDPSDYVKISVGSANDTADSQSTQKPFSVARTVEAALRRLRRPRKPLTIWIDAVCINQENTQERTQQVKLMSDIYSLATRVHIWLGDKDPGIEACLRLVREIYNFNERQCPGGDVCQCHGTPHSLKTETLDAKMQGKKENATFRGMHEIFHALKSQFPREVIDLAGGPKEAELSLLMSVLFANPWFSRVWVVQEVTLSHMCSVHCSDVVIPWKELVQVNTWLNAPQFARQRAHIESQIVMAPIWIILGKFRRSTRIGEPRRRHSPEPNELPGILEVFLLGLDLRATDPRDKLFALLTFGKGTCILGELNELIKPDYDKPVDQVFADFTRWWIRRHRSLSILSIIHCQPGRTWQNTLGPDDSAYPLKRPTWAVRSEGRLRWARANLDSQFKFRATKQRTPNLSLLDISDPFVLRLSGTRVSDIRAIGHASIEEFYPYDKEKNKRAEISTVFDTIVDPCEFTGIWTSANIPRFKNDSSQRAQLKYEDHLRCHWSYVPSPKLKALRIPTGRTLEWYETDRLPTCVSKCFFVASDGRFGLCPGTASEGDSIALLDGGKVPYLLRRVQDASRPEDDQFELVGECYVDGIMHGEYFDGKSENINPQQTFTLV